MNEAKTVNFCPCSYSIFLLSSAFHIFCNKTERKISNSFFVSQEKESSHKNVLLEKVCYFWLLKCWGSSISVIRMLNHLLLEIFCYFWLFKSWGYSISDERMFSHFYLQKVFYFLCLLFQKSINLKTY